MGKARFDYSNKITNYMKETSFSVYVFHYPILVSISYLTITYLQFPMIVNYVFILILDVVVTLLMGECCSKIPILKTLLLGHVYNKISN